MTRKNVTIRAAAYLRVSTKEQDESRQLPDIINSVMKDGAILEEHHIYRDKLSGLKNEKERDGLNDLLQLTKDDIDIVYLWEISRLSRDYIAFDELLNKFRQKGINVCFINPTKLYLFELGTTKESVMTSIVLTIISRIASYELIEKSARTKSGKRESINKGNSYTALPPYGYLKENKKLIIDNSKVSEIKGFESPFEIVRNIFNLYINGTSMGDIAIKLNKYNIPTNYKFYLKKDTIEYRKSGVTVNKDNLNWTRNSIYSILRNTTYAGYKIINQIDKVDDEELKREIRIETPSIIDYDTFLTSIEKRKDNINVAAKASKNEYLLRGLLICECGKYYSCATRSDKCYYRCADKQGANDNRLRIGCKNTDLNNKRVDYMIWETVKDLYKKYALMETRQKTISDFSDENKQIDNELSVIWKNIKNEENKYKNLIRRMSIVTDNVFNSLNSQSKEIESKINEYKQEVDKLKLKKSELKQYENRIDELKNMNFQNFDISLIENDFEAKKEAIRKIIESITVSNYFDDNNKRIVQLQINVINFGQLNNAERNIPIVIKYMPHEGIYNTNVFDTNDISENFIKKLPKL
jgi:DNA invertase Pin-like site-specific DNA recombinase